MTLRAAWTWFLAWCVGVALLSVVLLLPGWSIYKLAAYPFIPVFLCGGMGLVQYAIWTHRDDMDKSWRLLFMIPVVYLVQPLWLFVWVMIFDVSVRLGSLL